MCIEKLSACICSPSGSLSILKLINREEQVQFNLTLVSEDHGVPRLSSTQQLTVQVIDVNDEMPVFEESVYEAFITENQPAGATVLVVSASDLDQGKILLNEAH